MKQTNETISQIRGQVVRITKKKNLKLGNSQDCHFNAAEYAIENDCNFVCGWLKNRNSNLGIPHCICEKDGEYIDPTLNKEADFKIFHIYTFREIVKIFCKEGSFFIPFQGVYKKDTISVYDGLRKVKEEELRDWWIYIANMQYEDCLVHH